MRFKSLPTLKLNIMPTVTVPLYLLIAFAAFLLTVCFISFDRLLDKKETFRLTWGFAGFGILSLLIITTLVISTLN